MCGGRGRGCSGCGAGGADAGITLRPIIDAIKLADTLLAQGPVRHSKAHIRLSVKEIFQIIHFIKYVSTYKALSMSSSAFC